MSCSLSACCLYFLIDSCFIFLSKLWVSQSSRLSLVLTPLLSMVETISIIIARMWFILYLEQSALAFTASAVLSATHGHAFICTLDAELRPKHSGLLKATWLACDSGDARTQSFCCLVQHCFLQPTWPHGWRPTSARVCSRASLKGFFFPIL